MNVVVTGGGGFLGSKVITRLLKEKDRGAAPVPFDEIISLDLAPSPVADPRVRSVIGSILDPQLLASVVTERTVGVFHLAALLSGGSEEDFDRAVEVNVDGTRAMLEAARATGSAPRFVFTSSLAVFGGEVPDPVPEAFAPMPASTYGAVKAVGELLVNEYSRKGFIDGRVCRLPTISVRPGVPNSAASSFVSGIIREPFAGLDAPCPVPPDTRLWISSPDTAVANLVHAFAVEPERLGAWRTLNIPGITVTVVQMLESLERFGGAEARARVTLEPDERVRRIVGTWPGALDVDRLLGLGFTRDASMDDVVRQYRDELAS